MQFSPLVKRISGEGANAWRTHYEATAARDRGEDVIILSIGDPDIDAPKVVIERTVERLRAGDTHYTPARGREALRAAIAKAHSERTGQAVQADNVVCLAGTQNALFVASLCLAGPGDEVITFDPLYPTYTATIEVSGARLVRAPTGPGLRPDLAALESLVTPHTRAIFWATPNNPSGVILSDSELGAIGAIARRHRLWIVSDEVYAGLAPGGKIPSLASLLPDQVVTLGSLSKSHSMPGFRAGWLIGPRELAAHAESLSMCMLFGLPGFIQEAALTALQGSHAPELRIRELCTARRDFLLQGLDGVPGIRCSVPDAGMFTLIDVRDTGFSGYEFMSGLYKTERVSVLDGGAFGEATSGFVRLCFATDEATLREAMLRIRRYAETLARRSDPKRQRG